MIRRVALSAALAAGILAGDVVALTLLLNPRVRFSSEAAALALALFLPYALGGTFLLLALALARAALRSTSRTARSRDETEATPPLIRGLPCFGIFAVVVISAGATLYWTNLFAYRHSIPVAHVRALAGSAIALSAAVLILLAIGADSVLFRVRRRGASSALVILVAASALVVPLAARPAPGEPLSPVPLETEPVQPARRVVLLGVDGLGPEQIRQALARGLLPAVSRLLGRRGEGTPSAAYGPLATLRPTEGPPLWTTVMTGRLPRDHGIKSFVSYRLRGSSTSYELLPRGALVGLLERARLVVRRPAGPGARTRKALWTILNAFGIPTGVVRIWGTHPAEPVQGFMLSPFFYSLRHDPVRLTESVSPGEVAGQALLWVVEPADVDRSLLSQFVDLSESGEEPGIDWRRELVERALAPDLTYQRAGDALRRTYQPPFFTTYLYGLDPVGHAFTRYARPDRFGNVRPEEVRRYGRVIDGYLTLVNQAIDGAVTGLRSGDVLLVVSTYGMEPAPLGGRLLASLGLGPDLSGSHADAPDGFLLATGDGIAQGAMPTDASILDVAPTVLYLMGLPVARDMEGRALTEIADEAFARDHPLSFIPSYESLAVKPVAVRTDVDIEMLPLPDEENP